MKLYSPIWALLDDDAQEHCTYSWLLPCAKCPNCGGGNNFLGVLHYPNVDLRGQAMFKRCAGEKMNGEYVPWDEFLELRAALAAQMESPMPISDHTSFGPMTGKIKSAKTHILHPYPWAMLLPEPTLQILQQAGVNLTAIRSSIKAPPQISPVYDVYAPPMVRLSKRCAVKRPYCKTCCVTANELLSLHGEINKS